MAGGWLVTQLEGRSLFNAYATLAKTLINRLIILHYAYAAASKFNRPYNGSGALTFSPRLRNSHIGIADPELSAIRAPIVINVPSNFAIFGFVGGNGEAGFLYCWVWILFAVALLDRLYLAHTRYVCVCVYLVREFPRI